MKMFPSTNPLSYGSNPPPFWVDASALKSEKSAARWDVGENQWRLALQIESNSLRSTSFAATGGGYHRSNMIQLHIYDILWCLMEFCVSFHPGNEGTHCPRKHCFATWKQAAREDGPRWQHVVCCDVYGSGGHPTLAGRVQHSTCLGVLRHIQMVRNYKRQKWFPHVFMSYQ